MLCCIYKATPPGQCSSAIIYVQMICVFPGQKLGDATAAHSGIKCSTKLDKRSRSDIWHSEELETSLGAPGTTNVRTMAHQWPALASLAPANTVISLHGCRQTWSQRSLDS